MSLLVSLLGRCCVILSHQCHTAARVQSEQELLALLPEQQDSHKASHRGRRRNLVDPEQKSTFISLISKVTAGHMAGFACWFRQVGHRCFRQ